MLFYELYAKINKSSFMSDAEKVTVTFGVGLLWLYPWLRFEVKRLKTGENYGDLVQKIAVNVIRTD